MKRIVLSLLLLAPLAARAETAYVTDRLSVVLRSAAGEAATSVKALEVGAPLEVLERAGTYVRVRDRAGTEGWVETRFLTAEAPARAQLAPLQAELARTRAQLAEAQAQAKKLDTALAQESARVKELTKNAAAASAAMPPATPAPAAPAANAPAAPAAETGGEGGRTGVLVWVAVAFAMLGVGFGTGVWWLRESIRRRSGGMYLRV